MTTLTQPYWNVLTFIQHFEATHDRMCRNSDIQAGCKLESKRQTKDVLSYLAHKGLIHIIAKRMNGMTVWGARVNRDAVGDVGVEP